MAQSKKKKDIPEYSEIAKELKEMGVVLKKAFNESTKGEKAQKVKGKAQEAFDGFIADSKKIGKDIKTGELEKVFRSSLYNTVHKLNTKLEKQNKETKKPKKKTKASK